MNVHSFNDKEGLRIAAEIERRGLSFYERAQKITHSPAVKALLEELIPDERAHVAEFQRRYEARLANEEDYDSETSAYLSAVAADVVFPGGLTAVARERGFESAARILKYSIQSEKDAILFYVALAARAEDEALKAVFSDVIRQESAHLSKLQALLSEVDEV
jgi:rubrerythrin